MFKIKLAEKVFSIENKFQYVEKLCKDYLTTEPSQYFVKVTKEEIAKENQEDGLWSDAYLESLAIYRKICEKLLADNILLFHCSAIELDGKAYLFTAPSGTGKSTHTRLWREVFGDRVTMINDDKPLVSIPERSLEGGTCGDAVKVYGTPYAGKNGLQTNKSAPVAAIVVLHQAKGNTIGRLDAKSAYPTLLNQTYRRNDSEGMIKTLELVGQLAKIPVYSLGCTISREAVMLAYNRIIERNREK